MSYGNRIIASAEPKGMYLEGIIYGALLPGIMCQIRVAAGITAGEYTWEPYAPNASGDPRLVAILLEDDLQGGLMTTAYVSGTRGKLYVPLPGEQINVLLRDVAGTGDAHTFGERVVAETGTGKFIVQSTSANLAQFTLLEAIAAPTADTLALAMRA